jgi:hypothetical protein
MKGQPYVHNGMVLSPTDYGLRNRLEQAGRLWEKKSRNGIWVVN